MRDGRRVDRKDDRRLTLGKRTNQRTALKARTMDAGGIELFWSRWVRVRLPDSGVNARSDPRDVGFRLGSDSPLETTAAAPAPMRRGRIVDPASAERIS